jgi:hypothetical protein
VAERHQDSTRPVLTNERELILQRLAEVHKAIIEQYKRLADRVEAHEREIRELKQIASQSQVSSAALQSISMRLDMLAKLLQDNMAQDSITRADVDALKAELRGDATAAGRDTAKHHAKIWGGIGLAVATAVTILVNQCERRLLVEPAPVTAPSR